MRNEFLTQRARNNEKSFFVLCILEKLDALISCGTEIDIVDNSTELGESILTIRLRFIDIDIDPNEKKVLWISRSYMRDTGGCSDRVRFWVAHVLMKQTLHLLLYSRVSCLRAHSLRREESKQSTKRGRKKESFVSLFLSNIRFLSCRVMKRFSFGERTED